MIDAPPRPLRIAFTVYGQAAPAGSKRHVGNGRVVDASKRAAPWKNLVAEYAARAMDAHSERGRIMAEVNAESLLVGGVTQRNLDRLEKTPRVAQLLDGPLAVKMVFYVVRPKAHYRTSAQGLVHRTTRAREVLQAAVSDSLLRPSAPAWPTTRPDVLKLARAVEDACTGIIWRDDAQIVDEQLVKKYGEPARVEVTVMEA